MGEEVDIKLVEPAEEHPIFCDWKDPGNS